MTEDQVRSPHAVLDLRSRALKARKIESLLGLNAAGPLRILEVGAGSGGISHYFAQRGSGHSVDAVDVVDSRQVTDGYRFTLVAGTELPFPDASFDLVLSNHVIEHVGDDSRQREHLRELRRVIAPSGQAYLAVPNRWMLVEPHYKLPFLSWLPRPMRSAYLRRFRESQFYDCEPLEAAQLEAMLRSTGWCYDNLGLEAVVAMRRIEPGHRALDLFDALPGWLKRQLLPVLPTLIYRLRKPAGAA
jgi:SAM-dependent methyltransferase